MGLTPLPKVRVCRDYSNPLLRDPNAIDDWRLRNERVFKMLCKSVFIKELFKARE